MFTIRLVLFGIVLLNDVVVSEVHVALVIGFFGWLSNRVLQNISSYDSKRSFDVLFGNGFTAFITGESNSWIVNALKRTVKLEGVVVEFVFTVVGAVVYAELGHVIDSFSSLQEFMFSAFMVGIMSSEFVKSVIGVVKDKKSLSVAIEELRFHVSELNE